jgi:RNA polymerase sigma factor (TIGR02999 family)
MYAMEPNREEMTRLCHEAARGVNADRQSVDALVDHVYATLRRIADRQMMPERIDHTLSPTALVHEAYIKLLDQNAVDWNDRVHFYAVAARIMRRILIDHARRKLSGKRGGDKLRVTFTEEVGEAGLNFESLLELDRALDRLEELSPRQRQGVELRFFSGMKHDEVAAVLGVSEPTVRRDWRLAQAWLQREMTR